MTIIAGKSVETVPTSNLHVNFLVYEIVNPAPGVHPNSSPENKPVPKSFSYPLFDSKVILI